MTMSVFVARVKFITTKKRSVLSTKKIAEFIENPPKDKEDFSNEIIYTSLENYDGRKEKCGIQISFLCGT